ncbi:sugar O-acetyltransferase [Brochothrix thermosphacta]|uniref:sugar O-acetyltransferase n=1 Tax=Brochothrix thermosphacta TaxID=2756 RepID=UPI0004908F0D|nr:sugar O-acetyltransferase [Brochothrix thermosphacta]ODJ50237.1 galactoside O-acetyltransferase [Brochothrix thermosphacta DSM 20171 = FSL F6-1036]
MNQRERMIAGLPYIANKDASLVKERDELKIKVHKYNQLLPTQREELSKGIKAIFGNTGEAITVKQPFRCDYGANISVGENFYANYNCTILDVGPVTIGSNVQFAPNVSLFTAGHPVHPTSRNSGYEYGIAITIGDNVWIGGNTVVNPGVTIGENTVIGSGSVVTKDIPANVIAVGNPCRVFRAITEEDRDYYYKNQRFDVTDY